MEELRCKGTPTQVAQTILDFLRQDYELVAFANESFYGEDMETMLGQVNYWRHIWPTIPPDAPSIGIQVYRYLYDLPDFDSERLPDFVNGERTIVFYKYPLDKLGYIGLLALPDGTRLLAGERSFVQKVTDAGTIRRYVESSMPEALAPVWERVKAELLRMDLVIEAEPAQTPGDPVPQAESIALLRQMQPILAEVATGVRDLQAGQEHILARFDQQEQRILGPILARLDAQQAEQTTAILDALDAHLPCR